MQNQSSNMSHQMSKDQISQAHNSQKNLNQNYKGGKKKMASDDDEMNGDWVIKKTRITRQEKKLEKYPHA